MAYTQSSPVDLLSMTRCRNLETYKLLLQTAKKPEKALNLLIKCIGNIIVAWIFKTEND